MINLKGKTLFITGASRGIGKAIGLRAAGEGANIVIAAKTVEPHSKLPGTIHSAAAEMEASASLGLKPEEDLALDEAMSIELRAHELGAVPAFTGSAVGDVYPAVVLVIRMDRYLEEPALSADWKDIVTRPLADTVTGVGLSGSF